LFHIELYYNKFKFHKMVGENFLDHISLGEKSASPVGRAYGYPGHKWREKKAALPLS
jgi:hypothetical protein